MAKTKRKRLPKNFSELLEKGDLEELKAVFELCDLNAYGSYAKQSALSFDLCPDSLARWLVEKGADIDYQDSYGRAALHNRALSRRTSIKTILELGADIHKKDKYGNTPLHSAARYHHPGSARLLLEYGAECDALNEEQRTPLEYALYTCSNIDIIHMVELALVLLDAGAKKTPPLQSHVEQIGKEFEFHRSNFNPDLVDEVSQALERLYKIFDVTPVPRRLLHDGKSKIVLKTKRWQDQHQELWELLVPSSGACVTKQGEVIRISGRIANELEGNGGINWDSDFKKMADAYLEHLKSGNQLAQDEIDEAVTIVASIKKRSGDTSRMAELAVKWVLQNPTPVALEKVAYTR